MAPIAAFLIGYEAFAIFAIAPRQQKPKKHPTHCDVSLILLLVLD
jgi:hypothetical protein